MDCITSRRNSPETPKTETFDAEILLSLYRGGRKAAATTASLVFGLTAVAPRCGRASGGTHWRAYR